MARDPSADPVTPPLVQNFQKEHGVDLDKEKIITELICFAGNYIHRELLRLWADRSGAIFDHYIELCEANDVESR